MDGRQEFLVAEIGHARDLAVARGEQNGPQHAAGVDHVVDEDYPPIGVEAHTGSVKIDVKVSGARSSIRVRALTDLGREV